MSLVCFLSCGHSFGGTLGLVLLLLQNNMYPTTFVLSTPTPAMKCVLAPKAHIALCVHGGTNWTQWVTSMGVDIREGCVGVPSGSKGAVWSRFWKSLRYIAYMYKIVKELIKDILLKK